MKNDNKQVTARHWPRIVHQVCAAIALSSSCVVTGSSAYANDFEALPALTVAEAGKRVLLDITRAGGRLVAVGERGVVLYSDTGGNTWQQAVVPHSNTLTSVTFIDAQNGWAAGHGGIILHSGDGGQTGTKQFDGNQANQQWLNFIQQRRDSLAETIEELDDSQQAERDDLEYRLDDAEYALEDAALALQTGPVDPFLDIWFGDAKNGVAVGAYGMIYRTEDGGENWVIAAAGIENPDRYHYYDVDADRSGRLYLSGEAGLMYRSLDGGRQWQRLGPFYDGSLFGVVTRGEEVMAYGLRGHIFKSVDGGTRWQSLPAAPFSLYGGTRLADGTVILVGAGGGYLLGPEGAPFASKLHPSRSSFSSVSGDGSGRVVAVGMNGAAALPQGEASE